MIALYILSILTLGTGGGIVVARIASKPRRKTETWAEEFDDGVFWGSVRRTKASHPRIGNN